MTVSEPRVCLKRSS